MKKHDIAKLGNKVLTNYFSPTMIKQLRTATGDKFQFSIANGLASKSIRVAIATGNICVDEVETPEDKPSILSHHSVAALVREGHAADVVLDDATVDLTIGGVSGSVVMGCVDTTHSVYHTKEHLSKNSRWIKKITIAASSTTAYQTSMSVATLSPYRQTPEEVIDLNQYYRVDQYQNDKIELEFDREQLQWNDDFFWAINIPGGVTEQITVEFYD